MNIQVVKDYYGKTLQTSADLKTEACCSPDGMPAYVKRLLSNVHDEVLANYYGCGLVAPLSRADRAVSTQTARISPRRW